MKPGISGKIILGAFALIFIGGAAYLIFTTAPLAFLSRSPVINSTPLPLFLSPRDGEQIQMGSGTYTIQWNKENARFKDKQVSLYAISNLDEPGVSPVQFIIGKVDFNAGSYAWALPKDAGFASHFINTKKPVKLAMEIYAPPASVQAQRDVLYSGGIRFKPIRADARFIFPAGGERLLLGKPRVITWELSPQIRVSDVMLSLKPANPGKESADREHERDQILQERGDPLHEESSISSDARLYGWDGATIYVPHGHSMMPAKVKPGIYFLRLSFKTRDMYDQSINSEVFTLVGP